MRGLGGGVRLIHPNLVVQLDQASICGLHNLSAQAPKQVRSPLVQVDNVRCRAARMQAQPHDVHGFCGQLRCDALREDRQARIGVHDVPIAVQHYRRIRFMGGEDLAHRGTYRAELGGV